jgi:hypothetical protein
MSITNSGDQLNKRYILVWMNLYKKILTRYRTIFYGMIKDKLSNYIILQYNWCVLACFILFKGSVEGNLRWV